MWEACGTFVWTKATNPSRAKSTVDEKIIFFNSELKNTPYSYIAMSGNLGTTTKELQSLSVSYEGACAPQLYVSFPIHPKYACPF